MNITINNQVLRLKEMTTNRRVMIIALFTAAAATIYLLESLIPKPMPFMKIGLANIIPLILIISKNYREAFLILIAKIFVGGLISATLFSPTTLLSLSGGLTAFITMTLLFIMPVKFSIIGISIAGAVAHNLGQITAVRLLLIKENEIFYLTPLLIMMGLITGAITGYLAYLLVSKINMAGDR